MNRLMAKINPVGRGQQHTTPSAVGTPALKTGGAATGQHVGKDAATGGVGPAAVDTTTTAPESRDGVSPNGLITKSFAIGPTAAVSSARKRKSLSRSPLSAVSKNVVR